MCVAMFMFSLMNLVIRLVTEELHPVQIPFFRNLFAFIFMLPWAWSTGLRGLGTRQLPMHLLRATVGLASMLAWFSALAWLPLAEAVALSFTAPLFVTIGAALILGEVVRVRRWTATLVVFLGTLVILRPGYVEMAPITGLPIFAAVLMAGSMLTVKVLSRKDPPATIVFYMNLLMTPLSLVPALFVWQWPGGKVWLLLVLLGLLASVSHIFFTRAFALCDASAVQPLDFTRLPLVALLGYLFLGEVPSGWVWLGGAIIAGAAIYITRREAQVARGAEQER